MRNTRYGPRCLALLLALCLMPLVGLAQGQQPNSLFQGQLIDNGEQLRSMAVHQGEAWILTSAALYRWQPGMAEAVKAADAPESHEYGPEAPPAAHVIFSDGQALRGLDTQNGIVYAMQPDDQGLHLNKLVQLDWSPFDGSGKDGYRYPPEEISYASGRLYCRRENPVDDLTQDLYSFDLTSGQHKVHKPLHLHRLTPYREGGLLALQYNPMEQVSVKGIPQMRPARTVIYDPAKDSVAELRLLLPEDMSGEGNKDLKLAWLEKEDAFYAANSSGLYRLSEKDAPLLVARLPMAGNYMGALRTPALQPIQGQLLAADSTNAFPRLTDERLLKPAAELRLQARALNQQALIKALLELPEITLTDIHGFTQSPNELITQFMSREINLDILNLHSSMHDLERLKQKGYLLDLGAEPRLRAIYEDSFPRVAAAVAQERGIYGLPTQVQAQFPYVSAPDFEKLNRSIPTSIPELLDFVRWWSAEGHQQHPDYLLFDMPNVKATLRHMVHSAFVDSRLAQGQPLTYDMEVFGRYMLEIDALNTQDIEMPEEMHQEAMGNGSDNGDNRLKDYLIKTSIGYYAGIESAESGIRLLRLSIDGSQRPWRHAALDVLTIPATTAQPEAARAFLAAYYSKLDGLNLAAMSLSEQGPVPNPDYERTRRGQDEILAMYERRAAEAPQGPEKRRQEEIVAGIRENIAMFEKTGKYYLTREQLTQHKAVMQDFYFDDSLSLVINGALISEEGDLLNMYTEGAIDLAQFMQRANDHVRLMTMEQR